MKNSTGAINASADHSGRRRAMVAALGIIALLAATFTTGAVQATAAELPESFIDSASTQWNYSDDNSDPAAGSSDRLAWTAADYDDSMWRTAAGGFGAKNGTDTGLGANYPINTLLNHFINGESAPTVMTYHFRSQFALDSDQLDQIRSLRGTVVFDDAVQIFVNGTKVAGFVDDRVEDAPQDERNLMYAGDSNGSPLESTFTVPASALVAGENTIAVALYQDRDTSSDIYFDMRALEPVVASDTAGITDVVLTVGSTQQERNLAWYTDLDTPQEVQFAPAEHQTGADFPASAASVIPGSGGQTTSGEFNRFATLTGLEENTEYVYRIGSEGAGWSPTESFRTAGFWGDYSFLFFGDPQIGASGNVERDQAGWTDTLTVATETFPKTELLFSAGDQVEHATSEPQYEAFLAPEQLRQIPLVPVNGNHDVGSKAYEQHYNVPNLDRDAGAALSSSSSGGNYWFTYKDVLFMVINSNNTDVAAHEDFLRDVVAEHGDKAKWKVLAFHHSIYSVASHVNDDSIIKMRNTLPSLISEVGVDLVLQGHDHSYTRSYLIKDGELANPEETAAQPVVTAQPGEVLYVTANSASGSKYYDVRAPQAWYGSVINQERVRNYSNIEVTDDSISVTTLRSEQNGTQQPVNSVVDEVTLHRAADQSPSDPTVPGAGDDDGNADGDTETGTDPGADGTEPGDDATDDVADAGADETELGDDAVDDDSDTEQGVADDAGNSGSLPVTGAEVTALLTLTVALMLGGAWLIIAVRRRRAPGLV